MSFKLDHRLLADEMEIFFFDEQIGAGLPVWLPHGVALRESLEAFVKGLEDQAGYQRVVSPHVAKRELYEMSGHLRSFQKDMFPPMKWPDENSEYYLRPMNCPHHHKVFASSLRSYRQLPFRVAEYGQVYRYENSGSLRGLSRVRGLCQNDAHIYVDPKQAEDEILKVLELHEKCYEALGLKGFRYRLSKHDPRKMADFDGDGALWLQGEEILRRCLKKKNRPHFEAVGEAAFYGPKIDVQMKMGEGSEESIASVQLDFNSAEKFDLRYIASSGEAERPWIIHRAPLGSHERFVALLLEYYEGQLPGWLAPVQVAILPVSEEQSILAKDLRALFLENRLRVHVDQSVGSLSKRVRFVHKLRPFCKIILGPKEAGSGEIALEFRQEKILLKPSEAVQYLRNLVSPPRSKKGASD